MIDPDSERWRRLTVKEGWRRFVADEATERPERIRPGDYRRLDERARSAYDLERLRHAHGFGPIRSLYADVHRALERLLVSNELRGPGARHGAALDGNPGNGKTTIVSHFGRHYERSCRERYPHELTSDGHEYLPVVYVNVDAMPTIKGLNQAILTFYGMGPPKRANARELTQLVLQCARLCATSLIVIDDRTPGHDQRPHVPPARRQRPRPRASHADPHQPTPADPQAAGRRCGQRWGSRTSSPSRSAPSNWTRSAPKSRSRSTSTSRSRSSPTPSTGGLHPTYHNQTPDTIRDYLISGIGELRFTPGHTEVRLRRRTHTPRPARRRLRRPPHRGPLVGRTRPQLQLPRPLTQPQDHRRISEPIMQAKALVGKAFTLRDLDGYQRRSRSTTRSWRASAKSPRPAGCERNRSAPPCRY